MHESAHTSVDEVVQSPRKAPYMADVNKESDSSFREVLIEMRRGQDSFRREVIKAISYQTSATQEIAEEIRELRKASPTYLTQWIVSGVIVMALVAIFALASTRGVDVSGVADAVHLVTPNITPAP